MPHIINYVLFSQQLANGIEFSTYNLIKSNLYLSDILGGLALVSQHDAAQSMINGLVTGEAEKPQSTLFELWNAKHVGPFVYEAKQDSETAEHFLKKVLATDMVMIHWSEGQWYILTKNQQAATTDFMPLNDFIKYLYTSEQYPDELVEQLTEFKDFPLHVYEIEEYESETVFKICPIFVDAPSDLGNETNYVLKGEFVH